MKSPTAAGSSLSRFAPTRWIRASKSQPISMIRRRALSIASRAFLKYASASMMTPIRVALATRQNALLSMPTRYHPYQATG
ncbi:hypothetical protein [Sphingomonas sp. UYP23]